MQLFPVGLTTVTYSAIDDEGNTVSASFNVRVTDNENPVISGMPNDITVSNDAGLCSAVVSWNEPNASDNCNVASFISNFNSGAAFPVGLTTVTYSATDDEGNTVSASFNVRVTDNENPVISGMSNDITVSNDAGLCSAVVSWNEPNASDNCNVASFISNFNSGAAFPVGLTTVTYSATDDEGNTESASFNVRVTDNENPVISGMPNDITVSNDAGLCSAVVSWNEPNASDNCNVASFISNFNSGAAFPVGLTTVTYSATDDEGNTVSASFNVRVTDNENPVISGMPNDITVSNDAGLCSAVVSWNEPNASDNCNVASFISNFNSGAAFPVGLTTVTYSAIDDEGNTVSASFNVRVTDNENPVISGMPNDITVSNDAGLCSAVVSWNEPNASDNCNVASFISNFNSGAVFPVGLTTVTYSAIDDEGNTHSASFDITVVDNEKPIVNHPSLPVLSAECRITELVAPTATDNCGGQIEGVPNVILPITNNTTIIWTFTDVQGNSINQTQDVVITAGEVIWYADSDGDGLGDPNNWPRIVLSQLDTF